MVLSERFDRVIIIEHDTLSDAMVGEPTVFTKGYFDAFRPAAKQITDCAGLLAEARMIKTPQEIERMRLANELAAVGMAYA
ncbi:MAG: hypothetical protein L0154_29260, partial [Chloroflexi bacterium]|nr:hypothetical protein [Chloroflexota bacterium]